MRTNTVAAIHSVLPSLAVLAQGAKTRRGGRAIKLYRPEQSVLELTADALAAITALVKAGHTVRVYAKGSIFTMELDADGQLSWKNVKGTNTCIRPNVIVKVVC